MFKFRKVALLGVPVLAAAGVVGVAAPAFASGCQSSPTACASAPVTVSAAVASAITITGVGSPIQFGTVQPAVPTLASPDPAEQYTVATNAPHGFILSLQYMPNFMNDSPGIDTIPNNAITVQEKATSPSTITLTNSGTLMENTQLDSEAAAGSYPYKESWTLTAPATTPAGSYSGAVTYVAMANA